MSIATYSDLVAAVADLSHRADLLPRIPLFIQLAEMRIKMMLNERIQDSAQLLTTTPGVEFVLLPSDLLHIRSLSIPTLSPSIDYVTPAQYAESDQTAGGLPRQYTIIGQQLYLSPTPDAAYSMWAMLTAEFPPLSDAAPANALLARWPNVYLWGALVESMKFASNTERQAMHENDFQTAIAGINLLSWKTPGALRVKSDVRSV